MNKVTQDRSYYRLLTCRELRELVERGVGVDWKEMSIVLLERLEYEINLPRDTDSDYY